MAIVVFFTIPAKSAKITGIVEVISEYKPDPTDETGRFGLVEVKAIEEFPIPVTLSQIRSDPRLAGMVLVKNSRLSVQPVSANEWEIICHAGGLG